MEVRVFKSWNNPFSHSYGASKSKNILIDFYAEGYKFFSVISRTVHKKNKSKARKITVTFLD